MYSVKFADSSENVLLLRDLFHRILQNNASSTKEMIITLTEMIISRIQSLLVCCSIVAGGSIFAEKAHNNAQLYCIGYSCTGGKDIVQ